MGWEPVLYKGKWFELNNQVISWLQKFMELYFNSFNHPKWFENVIQDLHGNFFIPHGKYFFDEDIIAGDKERLDYCIKMIDLTICKMESMNKKDFFDYIKSAISGSWCDISNNLYNDDWFDDEKGYKDIYVGALNKLKDIMKD